MYAIISEIDKQSSLIIEKLRNECISACDLEMPVMKWPFHLSWQGAETYDLPETEHRVQMIANMFAPIDIHVDGIGIFTGDDPVLYFTITRSPTLTALGQTLWESMLPLSKGMNPLFSPEDWVPHISFIYGDANAAKTLSCVAMKLIPTQLGMTIRLDHLSLAYFQDEKSGIEFRCPLAGLSNISQQSMKGETKA